MKKNNQSKSFKITTDERMNPQLKEEIQGLRGLLWKNLPRLNKRFQISQCIDTPAILIMDTKTNRITTEIGLCDSHGAIQVLNELFGPKK